MHRLFMCPMEARQDRPVCEHSVRLLPSPFFARPVSAKLDRICAVEGVPEEDALP
jgi:hypothetical protein